MFDKFNFSSIFLNNFSLIFKQTEDGSLVNKDISYVTWLTYIKMYLWNKYCLLLNGLKNIFYLRTEMGLILECKTVLHKYITLVVL